MSKTQPLNGAKPLEAHNGEMRVPLLTLGLFVFVVGVYLPSYRYGFLFDESVILFRTVPPRTIGELIERLWAPHFPGLEYFRPIPHGTYLVQYMWARNEPGYFHVFNAIVMGITACVAFALLRLPCFGIRTIPAALAAALFAVHPAASSCVTPIVGRETLIAACLTMGAVYAFFRGGKAWYVASLFLLGFALLSKEQAIVIPVLFVLGDLLGLSEDAPGRHVGRWMNRYFPAVLVLMGYLVIRWFLFSGTEYSLQIFDRPFEPLISVGYALQTVFTPFGNLAYEPALGVWLSSVRLTIAIILLSILVWAVTHRCRVSRACVVFWLGWFLVSLAPTSNVIEQQAPYSERYVLLAIIAVVAVMASVVSKLQVSSQTRFWTVFVGLTVIAVSAATTIHRGRCFENGLTFSRQWARTSPSFGEAQMEFGVELHLNGETAEAANCFRAGIECEERVRSASRQWLGKMLLIQGRFAEAEQHFQLLIDDDPYAHYPRYFSGVALGGLGELDKATDRFNSAIKMNPQFGGAYFLLAETQRIQKNIPLSQQQLSIASTLPMIDLSFSQVTDSHLQTLSRFPNLQFLLLESTSISDEGLKHLRGMTALNRLWIPGTAISEQGLFHLRGLSNLNSLVLTNTPVTDAGVAHLLTLSGLRHLDIRNTRITREGIQKLKRELPQCLILY